MQKRVHFNWFVVTVVIVLGITAFTRCMDRGAKQTEGNAALQAYEEFAGSNKCVSCHTDIYNKHIQTAHYQTSAPATHSNIAGSFDNDKNSITYPNGSPRQAFRAGFREGVKMSLNQGGKVDPDNFKKIIWSGNYKRLITWCSVGADVDNGLWAMYGTRLGCYMTNLTDWDYVNVRDFDYLNNFFENTIRQKFVALPTARDIEKC